MLCQYLLFAYPFAVVAVAYAFYAGRGRRWTWAAYGLVALPWVLLLPWALGPLGLAGTFCMGLLGWYGWLKRERRSTTALDAGSPPPV